MSILPTELRRLLQLALHQPLVLSPAACPTVCGANVCAFLNGNGGYLLCGASEDGGVLGLDDASSQASALESILKACVRPAVLFAVEVHELNGMEFVGIEVPSGKDIPYAFDNDIFIHRQGQAEKADVETIRDMVLRKQIEPQRWERLLSSELDEDQLCKAACQRLFQSPRFPLMAEHPQKGLAQSLQVLSLASHGRFTHAADVLLAREPMRRHPQASVRAVCYSSKTAGEYQDLKHFAGPISEVIEQLFAFVMRNTPVRACFEPAGTRREDVPVYPPMAIREGIVNAFAHRDYSSFAGGIKVEISHGKVEIWNSGELPEGVEAGQLERAHVSILRNPDIAHALYVMGYMEKLGRGSLLIVQACREAGLETPVWQSSRASGVTLSFFAPYTTPEDTPEDTPEVTPEVERLIRVCKGEVRRQELQHRLGLKDAEHFRRQYLLAALEQGVIEMTLPHKPTSKLQKYRLTSLGKILEKSRSANN